MITRPLGTGSSLGGPYDACSLLLKTPQLLYTVLEQYVNKFEPSLRNRNVNGAVVTFSGNNAILTFDYTNDPDFAGVNPNNISQAERNQAYAELAELQGTANSFRSTIEANTGIKGAGMTVVMKLKGVELVRRSF